MRIHMVTPPVGGPQAKVRFEEFTLEMGQGLHLMATDIQVSCSTSRLDSLRNPVHAMMVNARRLS
eukprot:SAG11_NODE_1086_length_5931_cov_2.593450_2_plen_65_part_00